MFYDYICIVLNQPGIKIKLLGAKWILSKKLATNQLLSQYFIFFITFLSESFSLRCEVCSPWCIKEAGSYFAWGSKVACNTPTMERGFWDRMGGTHGEKGGVCENGCISSLLWTSDISLEDAERKCSTGAGCSEFQEVLPAYIWKVLNCFLWKRILLFINDCLFSFPDNLLGITIKITWIYL